MLGLSQETYKLGLYLLGAFVIGIIVMVIKEIIVNKFKDKFGLNTEKFSTTKFLNGFFNVLSPKEWSKTILTFFNARTMLVLGVVFSIVYGFGNYQGKKENSVAIGVPINGEYIDCKEKECFIRLNEHYMKITQEGDTSIVDADKTTVLKDIKVKDIEGFKVDILPVGLQFKPIAIGGIGMGASGASGEAGLGVSVAKFYNAELDGFLTNQGAYVGVSYRIKKVFKNFFKNTSLGIAVGKGYNGDNRILGYIRFLFG